jgi:hypothetical protein
MANRDEPTWIKVAALVIVLLFIAVIFGLNYYLRAHAPCSLFSVAEAPVRCLTNP